MPDEREADTGSPRAALARRLRPVAVAAMLLSPVFLTHGRALAEAAIDIVAVLFLVRSALLGDWRWTWTGWMRAGLPWWLWLAFSTAPFVAPRAPHPFGAFAEALAVVRFLVFACALERWTLRDARARDLLLLLLAVAFAYIAAQCFLQLLTGHNLWGDGRYPDGALTGPYDHPRAAAPLSRLAFPVLLPFAVRVASRPGGPVGGGAAVAIGLAGFALMVLAGQRMPLYLCLVGLGVVAIVDRRFRVAAVALAATLPVLLALASVVSPPAFRHLWTVFRSQVAHLPSTPYGLIAARAVAMVRAHPITGLGFDGYRRFCADPRYFHGWFGGDGRGAWAGVCVQHPHNHYLQAAVDGGLPGLVLFVLMVAAWLATVGRGLRGAARPDPLRLGLLAAVTMQEWPFASASDFVNLPLGGWFFLLLGFGLAQARPISPPARAAVSRSGRRGLRPRPAGG